MCHWNVRFVSELREPAFAPREVVDGKDTRDLAREILAMSQQEFSAAFENSPMKRANLRELKWNAAVVLGNIGSSDDVPALAGALDDQEALVRLHAARALGRIGARPKY